jgi:hypothetical protein
MVGEGPFGTKNPGGILPFFLGRTTASVLAPGQTRVSFGSPVTPDAATLNSSFPRAEPSPPPTSWRQRPVEDHVWFEDRWMVASLYDE